MGGSRFFTASLWRVGYEVGRSAGPVRRANVLKATNVWVLCASAGRVGSARWPSVGHAEAGRGGVWKMGDVVYLLIVAAFFALAIGYARVAPRL